MGYRCLVWFGLMLHLPVQGIISGGDGGDDPLLTGMTSWWSFDETSGTRFDSHGSNDMADPTGTGFAPGKVSNAADFLLDYLNLPTASSSGLTGTGTFTVCGWVKLAVVASDFQAFFVRSNALTNTQGLIDWSCLMRGSGSSNTLSMRVTVGSTPIVADSGITAIVGTWYFIVGYYDEANDEVAVSINDGAFTTTTVTGTINNIANEIKFGRNSGFSSTWFGYTNGLLDEWVHWNRLLTPAETARLYNSGNGIGYPG